MKLITAIIKPYMLEKLARALTKSAVSGFTVTDVRGWSRSNTTETELLSHQFRVDMVVLPDDVEKVVALIMQTVSTHQEGDGILYVQDVESVMNIRTGAVGREALLLK